MSTVSIYDFDDVKKIHYATDGANSIMFSSEAFKRGDDCIGVYIDANHEPRLIARYSKYGQAYANLMSEPQQAG